MKRELSSQLYTPSTYFLGRYFSSMLLQIGYPLLTVLTLYWGLGFETHPDVFFLFLLFTTVASFVCCGQGFVVGVVVDDEDSGKVVNVLISTIFYMTSGGFFNIGTANPFVRFLCDISCLRLLQESLVRLFTEYLSEVTAPSGEVVFS